jgi:serine/threonine protein kinase
MAEGHPPNNDIESIQQLSVIINRPTPTLKRGRFSPLAKDFLAKCLVKDPNNRGDAAEMLKVKMLIKSQSHEI